MARRCYIISTKRAEALYLGRQRYIISTNKLGNIGEIIQINPSYPFEILLRIINFRPKAMEDLVTKDVIPAGWTISSLLESYLRRCEDPNPEQVFYITEVERC